MRHLANWVVLLALSALVMVGPSGSAYAADDYASRIHGFIASLDYAKGMEAAEAWIADARQTAGADSLTFARAIDAKATLLHLQGRVVEADPLFNEVLSIRRAKLPADDPDLAAAMNNVGMQHIWLGRYQEGLQLLQTALDIREKRFPANDPQIADSLANLTYAYLYLNRTSEAFAIAERAKAIAVATGTVGDERFSRVLQNLASAQERTGDYAGAEANLRQALKLLVDSGASQFFRRSAVQVRLAINLYLQGRHKDAEASFREAIAGLERSPTTLTTPAALTDFALNQIEQGQFDEAESLLTRALEMRRALMPAGNHEIARTMSNLAEVKYRRGQFAEAQKLNVEAVDMVAMLGKTNDIALLQFMRLVRSSWALYEREKDEGVRRQLAETAFAAAQRAAETSTAKTVAHMAARFAADDPKLSDLVKTLQDLDSEEYALQQRISHALALPIGERTALGPDDTRTRLDDIQKRKADINLEVARAFPRYSELANPKPISIATIQPLLDANEALIFAVPLVDATWVYAITKDGVQWVRVALSNSDVDKFVAMLRNQVLVLDDLRAGKTPPLFDLGFSYDLYQKLFTEIGRTVKGKDHLLIAASGALDRFPFGLLVTEKPKVRRPTLDQFTLYRSAAWLARRAAISVLPSVASIEALRTSKSGAQIQKPMLAFANPIFGAAVTATNAEASTSASENPKPATAELVESFGASHVDRSSLRSKLAPLPETEDEVKSVAKSVGADANDIITGTNATETAVKHAQLADYRVLYFATHGLMAGEIAGLDEPALVLTIPDTPTADDDGLLTTSEISALKLNADLVVLSACNTAAPQSGSSEGLSGLAKAFFQAGARAMLVSHWAVPSEAAARLTTSMFEIQHKEPGIGRAKALQRSIIALQDDKESKTDFYPTFWAPFVLVGDGRQ